MKSAEKMKTITQHVERSSQEQTRGGRQIAQSIENIAERVNRLHGAQRDQSREGEHIREALGRLHEIARNQEQKLSSLAQGLSRAEEGQRGLQDELGNFRL